MQMQALRKRPGARGDADTQDTQSAQATTENRCCRHQRGTATIAVKPGRGKHRRWAGVPYFSLRLLSAIQVRRSRRCARINLQGSGRKGKYYTKHKAHNKRQPSASNGRSRHHSLQISLPINCRIQIKTKRENHQPVTMLQSSSLLKAARLASSGASARRVFARYGPGQGAFSAHFASLAGVTVPSWATVDPSAMGVDTEPYHMQNLVDGQWTPAKASMSIPDPTNKDAPPIFTTPDTQVDELAPFVESLRKVPKSGMHNPLKNPDRYLQYGEISRLAGHALSQPDVAEYFAQTIMKCVPKSHGQARGEVMVTAAFLNNFGGDNVRRLAKSFGVPGDHYGQMSIGHRWPYGPVALVTPFNFPLEIPVLQLMGALFMGNKPVLKPSEQVSIVMEQFIRLLIDCGMDPADVDLLNCKGPVAQELIVDTPVRLTQFTGSSRVGELLSQATNGKVVLEDAGFDWKVIGPDVDDVDYVAWQCDQDAYATIGQKCSAQSICFVHENWKEVGLLDKMKALASKRSFDDFTNGPVLTVSTQELLDHTKRLSSIPGASVLWGGKAVTGHNIPDKYGAVEPTAVFVPLEEMMKPDHFETCVTEYFAPFQVVTYYNDSNVDVVLEALEGVSHHLTAAVVSNDPAFQTKILANTVNGTTYAGRRARTTGAPQNHWFGPAGDPRGCGIGTPEAIQLVWSCHREIISDSFVPEDWVQPKAT